jgi:hypothetical protein
VPGGAGAGGADSQEGGAGLCFILYKLLGIFIGMVPMLAVAGLSLALTFYKPNNKPFVDMLEASFKYFTQDKLYIWKRHELRKGNTGSKDQNLVEINSNKNNYEKSRLTGNKLRDLAWSLDVLDLKK